MITSLVRVGFVAYAIVLAVATHIPGLKVEGPVQRPDLVIHLAAFGIWGFMFAATAWAGPPGRLRPAIIAIVTVAIYGAVDESTQAFVGRHVALDDYVANLVGGALGVTIANSAAFIARRSSRSRGLAAEA